MHSARRVAIALDQGHALGMEPEDKNEALFSHPDDASTDARAEASKPAVYTALFSGAND